MIFKEAIDSVLIKNYFTFKGRATRSEYWWFVLFSSVSMMVASIFEVIVVGTFQGERFDPDNFYPYLTLLYICFLFIPTLSVSVRRFHDVGKTTKEAISIFVVM